MDLEGRFCWLYNILMALKILQLDAWDESTADTFTLRLQPRWFWQRKKEAHHE